MNEAVLDKIELEVFNNRIGLEIGMSIVGLAQRRGQRIAVQVERLNHIIFLFVDDNLVADKHNWLRRKANVVRNFEESSLKVKSDLESGSMSLEETFGLSSNDYLAKGGAIPIFVKDIGMVAIVTVSGLQDIEDHNIIVDALNS